MRIYRERLPYHTPLLWQSDNLTNQEIGWKTEWLDHRLQVNGAVYQEIWANVQTQLFDPAQGLGNLTFNTNGPDYKVRGIELQIVAQPDARAHGHEFHGLELERAHQLALAGEQQSWQPERCARRPLHRRRHVELRSGDHRHPECVRRQGSRLAMSPPFEASSRVRYEWNLRDYHYFAQFGGEPLSGIRFRQRQRESFVMPGYTTYDGSFGVGKDNWVVTAYGQNLLDNESSIYTSGNQFVVTETVLRPRILGLKFAYKFSDKK